MKLKLIFVFVSCIKGYSVVIIWWRFSIFKYNRQLIKTSISKWHFLYEIWTSSNIKETYTKYFFFFFLFFFYIRVIKNLTIKVLCNQFSCFYTSIIPSFILLQFCMNNYLKNRLVFKILTEIRVLCESLIYIFIVLHLKQFFKNKLIKISVSIENYVTAYLNIYFSISRNMEHQFYSEIDLVLMCTQYKILL